MVLFKIASLLLLMLTIARAESAMGQENAIQQALNQWRAKQDRLQSVRYTISGTIDWKNVELPPGMQIKSLPSSVDQLPFKAILLIDLANKRYRLERHEKTLSPEKGIILRVTIHTYNLKELQTAIPRDINELSPETPEIVISKGDMSQTQIDSVLWPVFEAHGLVPTVQMPLQIDKWPANHQREEFLDRGRISHDGVSYRVFRTEPAESAPALIDEIWVDLKREGLVARHTYFSGKNPWVIIHTQHKKTENGWLPSQWTSTRTMGGKVQSVGNFKVDLIEPNIVVNDSDFNLPIEPGMLVSVSETPPRGKGLNISYPAYTVYRAERNSGKEIVEEKGFTTIQGQTLPPEKSRRQEWWWAGSILFGMVVASTLIRYRYRDRKANRSIR